MSAQQHNAHPTKRPRVGERTMLACINCKQRKLKCDGQSPKCRNCARTSRDCLVEDPATGMHRPRDYIRSLESRVAYLEGLLQEVRPEVARDHLGALVPQPEGEASPSAAFLQQPQVGGSPGGDEQRSANADNSAVDVLSNEVALLCLGAAGREPQYFGPSSAVPFSRIVSTTLGLPRREAGKGSQPSVVGETDARANAALVIDFPSPEKMARLSEAYFSSIHPQYPFLHRPTFHLMEKECLEANMRGELSAASDVSLFFVLGVYAIASIALGHTEVNAAEGYYAMALEHIAPLLDLDNLQSVQALLCCAVYSIRSSVGASLWKISGMAIRHCVELGYHRSTEKYRGSANRLTKEMSKRCFWVAYDIDRVVSFILGRPGGISDHAIDVELPLDINDEDISANDSVCNIRSNAADPPTTMTGALHVIRLRQLWSKISDNLYSGMSYSPNDRNTQTVISIETLREELEEWRATIPDRLDSSLSHPHSVFASNDWFQLAYDYSILLLYRHYIIEGPESARYVPSSHDDDTSHVRERALEVCFERARDMCLLYRRLYQSQGSHIQFTWGSLHILFLGGLTYLYCLWRSPTIRQRTRQTTVMNTCMACSTVLIIIAERWSEASSYRDIFEALSERTISMMCMDDGDKNASSSLILSLGSAQFADANNANMHGMPDGDGRELAQSDAYDPLQNWIIGLDYMTAPGDPQWLAQELLQGIRGFEAGTAPNVLDE